MPQTFTARAVLLDMDGTLVDSTAVVERVWREWALQHDVDPADVLAVAHGRQGHETMALVLPDRDAAANDADNVRLLAAETAQTDGVVAVAGAYDLLASLTRAPHALVTSADEALAAARMGASDLPMPAVRVTAEHVMRSKPDPEGFLLAARLLGVAPADCVVFEDSGAGIAAGLAAGMTVIGVGPRAEGQGAAAVVPDLARVQTSIAEPDIRITLA